MILSRFLGKRRVAAGQRPGWAAAWGPVAFDAVVFSGYVALIFGPILRADALGTAAVIALLFVLVFVPMQIVLILSALWAAKSRGMEEDGTNPQTPRFTR